MCIDVTEAIHMMHTSDDELGAKSARYVRTYVHTHVSDTYRSCPEIYGFCIEHLKYVQFRKGGRFVLYRVFVFLPCCRLELLTVDGSDS